MIDTLVVHELDFSITPADITARSEEWAANVLKNHRSREEYNKALAAFVGIDLIKYSYADVKRHPKTGEFTVKLRSKHWRDKQPK